MYILKKKKSNIVVYVSDDKEYDFDKKNLERIEVKGNRKSWLKKNNLPEFNWGQELIKRKIKIC